MRTVHKRRLQRQRRGKLRLASLTQVGKRCEVCAIAIDIGQQVVTFAGGRVEHLNCAQRTGVILTSAQLPAISAPPPLGEREEEGVPEPAGEKSEAAMEVVA